MVVSATVDGKSVMFAVVSKDFVVSSKIVVSIERILIGVEDLVISVDTGINIFEVEIIVSVLVSVVVKFSVVGVAVGGSGVNVMDEGDIFVPVLAIEELDRGLA